MKKIIFAAALATSPLIASGNQQDTRIDLLKIDTNKFCVYEGNVYSIGSVIEASGQSLKCDYSSTNFNGIPSGAYWANVSK